MWNKVLILPVPMVKLMQIFIMVKMFDQVAMECDQNEEFYREFSTRLSKVVRYELKKVRLFMKRIKVENGCIDFRENIKLILSLGLIKGK
jgi:hypothetical protein